MASKDGKVPQFDGTNFSFWKIIMEYYLISLGIEVSKYIIDGYNIPYPLPTDLDGKKAYVENKKALNSIASGLPNSKFTKVMGIRITKDMLDKLIHIYEGDEKVKKEKLQTYIR